MTLPHASFPRRAAPLAALFPAPLPALLLSLPLALLLTGCADMPLTESGFLSDYTQLEDAPQLEVWGVPDALRVQVGGLTSATPGKPVLYLEPVRFIPANARARSYGAADRAALIQAFEESLVAELSPAFRLADAAGPGVYTLRAAVTDAEPSTPWVNWVMVILLMPTSYGGASGEMELLDDRGRQVMALTAAREGTAFLLLEAFSRWGHARHSMEKWGAEWRRMLQAAEG